MGRRRKNFTFSFRGSLSSNAVYSTPHWTKRQKMKQTWHSKYRKIIKDTYPKQPSKRIDQYEITLRCRNRLDIDNNGMMVKWFVDTLREEGWVVEDSTKHFVSLTIIADRSMDSNTGEFTLTALKYEE